MVLGFSELKRLVILHLSLIEGVGPATIAQIIKAKPHDCAWDALYAFTTSDWMAWGVSYKSAELLKAGLANRVLLERELTHIQKHGIAWLVIGDPEYPVLLQQITCPPAVIYYQGASFSAHEKNIALVGSRGADAYAQRVIDLFVPSLVAHSWSLVSGGAVGVDSMVHRATLQANGKTVVVLGSGLLRPYPRSNSALFERVIANGGTVISSFGLTVDPIAHNFPARNRIIAGLSVGCVVVQAAHKSGASITAEYALEQGRTVFAVPGMIDNPLSVGCHALLREGASVATSAEDILAELGESVEHRPQQLTFVQHNYEAQKSTKAQSNVMRDRVSTQETAQVSSARAAVQAFTGHATKEHGNVPAHGYALDSIEARVIRFCAKPAFLDDIAQACALSFPDTQQLLFNLQLEGLIAQNFAGQWESKSV